MPFDYSSTAQALNLSPSPSPSPLPSPTSPHHPSHDAGDRLPPWARPPPGRGPDSGDGSRLPGARRLSTPYSRGRDSAEHRPLGQRILQGGVAVTNNLVRLGYSMTPLQRVVSGVVGLGVFALTIVFLVFSSRIFAALRPVAESWRGLPGGWVLLFLLSAASAFPPLIGYSTTITLAGFVFGFPAGWPIVASATVCGSAAAFVASRTVLSGYVQRLVGEDRRFVALGQVLRRDGLPVLVAIRFCPLPFSLSNGFLATIPSISPGTFVLATALSTPKLLIHVFIGDRLAQLADSEDMPTSARVINYLSILFGSVVGITVGWFVYQRTMRRAKELALEEAAATDGDGILLPDESDYQDVEEGVLGPVQTRRVGESDAAALMDDDDISLWDATESPRGLYRDDDDTSTSPSFSRGDGEVASRHPDTT
ncbi:putative tlg2-vesicle protein of 38 kda protein [Rosellinia necatrix]|uniref:Golgi apparatus membrane protein TVP38 n=1 Tax=Rosellinia necatrix TaxID=77044 RepID=A0A1W2TDY9_ROSNE|nr:putative tlg2-vesicle protein of 38 kda protein [Rosellinia necatrix]